MKNPTWKETTEIKNTDPSWEDTSEMTGDQAVFRVPNETTINQDAYINAFSQDEPLAAFEPQKQEQLKLMLSSSDDPKTEARKQLLCHFLSSRSQMAPEMVYKNFDHAAQVYNGGEKIGSEALWQKIKLQFTPIEGSEENPDDPYSMLGGDNQFSRVKKQSPQEDLAEAQKNGELKPSKFKNKLDAGIYETISSTKMLPVLLMDIAKEAGKGRHVSRTSERWGASDKPLDQQKWFMGKNWKPKAEEKSAVREYFLEGAKTYRDAAVYLDKEIGNDKNILDTFKQDGAAAGAEKLFYEIVKTSPQLFTQIVFTLANPFAGPAYMGASSAGSGYLDVMDDPDMHMGEKLVNVTFNAGSEVASEYVFSNPLIRGMLKGAPKSKIMEGFSTAIGKLVKSKGTRKALNIAGGFFLGGAEETSGEVLNQISINYTNIITHKDGANLDKLTNEQLLKKLIVGVPDTAMISFAIGGNFGAIGALQNSSYADMDLAHAEAKQVTQVRKEELLAKEDPSDQEIAELNEIEETENDPISAPVLNVLMDAAGMDTEQKEATKARRRILVQNKPVDIGTSAKNIEAAVNEIGFAGKFNIVENQSELPDDIQQAASKFDGSKVEGVIDTNNDIWFVAGNIAPHRAAKVALHEIVGHYGLNGAFGEKLNPLLNQIWNERAGDIRLEMDSFGYDFDYSGEAGKLQAAEEFLARTAESSEKPKWWKEVIAQARTFLRKVMPNMRFTDNDINSLLAKAGKHVKGINSNNPGSRFSLASDLDSKEVSSRIFADADTSENFLDKPDHDRRLHDLPANVLNELDKENKPLILKKNIVEKNKEAHGELSATDSLEILHDSILGCELLIQPSPFEKPNYFMLVIKGHQNKQALVEISEDKDQYEVVNWHYIGTRRLEQKIQRAEKENGIIKEIRRGELPTLTITDEIAGAAGRLSALTPDKNSINDNNGNVKFSSKNIAELISDHAAAIVPQVRRKEIVSTSDLREVYPDLTEGQAENVLLAARDLMRKNNKKRNDELFRQWRSDVLPLLDDLENQYPNGIKPDKKYGTRQDITGSYINWTKGEASDVASVFLGIEEDELIETLDGLTKKKIKAEYNQQYSDKAMKQRYELEALQMRREEVQQLKEEILTGIADPEIKQLRKYPEMSDFFEELVTGKIKFEGNDVALARIAALSDPAADSSEMLDRYRILRHIQYLKDSDAKKHGTAARKYIADYARKFMPTEEHHRILKYLKKEIISPAVLKKALKEIEAFEAEGSQIKKLKEKLDSAYVQINKISPRLRDHYDRIEVLEDLQKIARQLPDDVRKGELNKITKLLAKAASAANENTINRSVKVGEDENGLALYDDQELTMLESLVDDAFNVVSIAVERSEKNKTIEDIKKTFAWVKIGKTPKGIPEGKLTPNVQITVDKWRAIYELLPSQIADYKTRLVNGLVKEGEIDPVEDFAKRKEGFFNEVSNNPDNVSAAEELAALGLFGDLDNQDLEQVKEAQKVLDHLVDTGRVLYKDQIMEDIRQRAADRADWIEYSTGGKDLLSDAEAQRAAEKRKNNFLQSLKNFQRGNLSFEWLLNSLSRLDKDHETLKSPMARELSRDVHRATQTESSAIRNKQLELTNKLEEIFDTKGRGLDRKLNDFKKMKEDTGVFRYPENKRPVMTLYVTEAQDLINSLPEGHEDRIKLERAVARARMDNKRKVHINEGTELGAGEEVPMSKDEALNFWLIWQQPDKRMNMTEHHWTEESIKQLEKFLGDEGLALGKHLQDLYRKEYYSINAVFKRLFHINMPQLKNYAPAVFDVFGGKDTAMMPDAAEGMSGLNPGSLISRRSHNEKPKQLGASDVYLMHTAQMEHWKAWAGTVKRLRGVFCGKEVRLAVQQHYGEKAYSQVLEKINHFADGGNRNVKVHTWIDKLRKGFTTSKLAFNIGVFVKQLTSLPAYGMDMPISSFVKYSADFWKNPVKNAKFLIESSDYIKNRWGEGYERDVMRLLRDSGKKRNILSRGIEAGMLSGKAGDIIPILIGGHAVYKHNYNKMVRDGVHPDQAHAEAMIEFEMNTDRTQQAGNTKDLGIYQSGGSIDRMFTMFTTSPRQYMQHMTETFGDALAGKKGAKKAATKKIIIAQFILPLLFQLVSDVMRKGFDEDEYDGGDYIRAMIVGPLNGYFVAGKIFDEFADHLLAGKTYGGSDSAVALSDRKYLNRSVKRFNKAVKEGDWQVETLLKVADEAARGTSAVFAPATAYSIGRREYKRFNGLFGRKKKKNHR